MTSTENTIQTTNKSTKILRFLFLPTALKFILFIWLSFFVGWGVVYFYVLAVADNYNNLFGEMPSIEELQNPKTEIASEIYSADGVLLGKYYRSNRTPLSYDEISPTMLNALYATEDIRFFNHSGIDQKGTLSIPYYLLKGKKKGASTITQQLAKNLFETRRKEEFIGSLSKGKFKKVIDKTKEWILATRLENMYSKHEVVSMYLNTVFFGKNAYGLKVAAKTFFNKDQKDLNVEEAALLTGVLKGPSQFSPTLHPEAALGRRNTVLSQMAKYNKITITQKDSLIQDSIHLSLNEEDHNQGVAPYFRKVLGNYLRRWCKANNYDLYSDGLKVYTTLDSRLQKYGEEAAWDHMKYLQEKFFEHWKGRKPWVLKRNKQFVEYKGFLDLAIKRTEAYRNLKKHYGDDTTSIQKALRKKRPITVFSYNGPIDTLFSTYDSLEYYKHFLHNGFVVMSPTTGDIKVWVGGVDHTYFKFDHVRQGKRQPGSTFKPIVYATILGETGNVYSPCYKVVDAPVTFVTDDPENPTWTPANAEGKYTGDTLSLRQAMARSVNSITAYMMKLMGKQTPAKVRDYAYQLGIEGPLEAVPAMCLGVFDVSIYELVGAYSTFVNEGYYTKPRFITHIKDKHGNVVKSFVPERTKVLSDELSYTMLYMLRGATEEKGGTGLGLYRYQLFGDENQIGGKTGTTQNHSDGWFMGVTKDLVAGAWVGGEDRSIHFRSLEYGQGARMSLPIYGKFMQKVYADSTLGITKGPFIMPKSLQKEVEKHNDKYLYEFDCNNRLSDTLKVKKPKPIIIEEIEFE